MIWFIQAGGRNCNCRRCHGAPASLDDSRSTTCTSGNSELVPRRIFNREHPVMAGYPELKLYIGGEWKSAEGIPVINPADESVLGTVPHATWADLNDALATAEEGFRLWSRTSPAKRADIILRAAQIMRGRV